MALRSDGGTVSVTPSSSSPGRELVDGAEGPAGDLDAVREGGDGGRRRGGS